MVNIKSFFPKPIYLGAAIRSPIGKFGGGLKHLTAPNLAALTLKEALKRAPEAPLPDVVFLGHGRQAGAGPNTARQCAIFSGLPETIPAITVNQACASGMTALFCGVDKILVNRAHSVWAGGVESMSNTPYLLMNARWGYRLGNGILEDAMYRDGFFCPLSQMIMGETVEKFLVKDYKISREEQDLFAFHSQKKAYEAQTKGLFLNETFEVPGDAKIPSLRNDEHIRKDTTIEGLKKLKPVFDPENGTITAGNSSGITDGAAFFHLSDTVYSHTQVEILDYEHIALDPKRMGLGPVGATLKLLERHKLKIEDFEVIELNEAFAAQVIACNRELHIPEEKLNPRGGGVALGHPIGASGARIVVTLVHQLTNKKGALGLATLCVSGGQGASVIVRAL